MSNNSFDDTVVDNFPVSTVISTKRLRDNFMTFNYSSIRCNLCGEWWIMLCVADRDRVFCPWCGSDCELLTTPREDGK